MFSFVSIPSLIHAYLNGPPQKCTEATLPARESGSMTMPERPVAQSLGDRSPYRPSPHPWYAAVPQDVDIDSLQAIDARGVSSRLQNVFFRYGMHHAACEHHRVAVTSSGVAIGSLRSPKIVRRSSRPGRSVPAMPVLTNSTASWRATTQASRRRPTPFGLHPSGQRAAALLPVELQLEILRHTDDRALVMFAATNRDARALATEIACERYETVRVPHRLVSPRNRADALNYFAEAVLIERLFATWPGGGEERPRTVDAFPQRVSDMLEAVPVADCDEGWFDYLPPPKIENVRQAAYILRFTAQSCAISAGYLDAHASVQAELGHAEEAAQALLQMRQIRPRLPQAALDLARAGVILAAVHRDDTSILSALAKYYRIDRHQVVGLAMRHGSMRVMNQMWSWGGRASTKVKCDTRSQLSGIAWKINSWGFLNPYRVPFDIDLDTLDSRRATLKAYEAKLDAVSPLRHCRYHYRRMPLRSWH